MTEALILQLAFFLLGKAFQDILRRLPLKTNHANKKIKGETRISAGVYEIGLRKNTPMANEYDSKYADINHDGMIEILNVPNFTNIYLHIGNDEKDTDGCPLLNDNAYHDPLNGGGSGGKSTLAYKRIYPLIKSALDAGERVYIEVKDEF
uniref:DUF5675 domain-containing protein n=1 Tax=uncultured marine virus TaxID=186617 RepID=A0A0F7L135_9VIRU|nr:hypothetical protein [uncultured marine virus]